MLEGTEEDANDLVGIDPEAPTDLREGNDGSVDLAVLIVVPSLILDMVLSLHLRVGALRQRPRGERQAREDENGLYAGLVKLAQIALDTVRERQRKTAS